LSLSLFHSFFPYLKLFECWFYFVMVSLLPWPLPTVSACNQGSLGACRCSSLATSFASLDGSMGQGMFYANPRKTAKVKMLSPDPQKNQAIRKWIGVALLCLISNMKLIELCTVQLPITTFECWAVRKAVAEHEFQTCLHYPGTNPIPEVIPMATYVFKSRFHCISSNCTGSIQSLSQNDKMFQCLSLWEFQELIFKRTIPGPQPRKLAPHHGQNLLGLRSRRNPGAGSRRLGIHLRGTRFAALNYEH
jgi:hypothetical protein